VKNLLKYLGLGIIFSLGIFFSFGMITALIPNKFFIRMIEPNSLDYVFLSLTSVLLGSYFSLTMYRKNKDNKCDYVAGGGTLLGVFAFACPVCNTLLVSLFGFTAVMMYFEPYRPILGIFSVVLLGSLLVSKIKTLRLKEKKNF